MKEEDVQGCDDIIQDGSGWPHVVEIHVQGEMYIVQGCDDIIYDRLGQATRVGDSCTGRRCMWW